VTLASDQAHLLRALVRNGVEFVIVGGVAAQLRGWVGTTADLDIAVAGDGDNATRLNRAPRRSA
jgi:diphthamide synthase (EF-2-diphthine--ammonia ligase)